MKTVAAILLAFALLTSARTGICQESPKPAESRSWYGYQTLLADGLSYAVILASVGNNNSASGIAGLGTFLVASPVIHGLNHEGTNLGISVLLRLGLPLAGFAIGSGQGDCRDSEDESFCSFLSGVKGLAIGMLAATVIDSALAWKSTGATQPAPPRRIAPPESRTTFSMSSVGVVPTANGASLVVGGSF